MCKGKREAIARAIIKESIVKDLAFSLTPLQWKLLSALTGVPEPISAVAKMALLEVAFPKKTTNGHPAV